MRIQSTLILAILTAAMPVCAQSNAAVDELLSQEKARLGSAAYMILNAGGRIGEEASGDDALAAAKEAGLVSASRTTGDAIRLDELCSLVMRSLELKGGIMYSLFPGPRYAYRELVSRGIVNSSGGPKRSVAGDELLRILRLALDLKGGEK